MNKGNKAKEEILQLFFDAFAAGYNRKADGKDFGSFAKEKVELEKAYLGKNINLVCEYINTLTEAE